MRRPGPPAPSRLGWGLLRFGAATAVIAGIVHLTAVLVLSRDVATGPFATVAKLTPLPLATVAAPPSAERVLPFRDPAMAQAFCRFDLRDGPLEVSLPVTPLDVADLSVYDRGGRAVYALTSRSAVRGVLAVTVASSGPAATDDADDGVPRVTIEGTEGFVMAGALAAMPSARPEAEATARGLACRSASKG